MKQAMLQQSATITPPAETDQRGLLAAVQQPARTGQLFRKYLLTFVGLVGISLLVSAGVELYFSYMEIEQDLVNRQRETAASATVKISLFLEELERQVQWAMPPGRRDLPAGLDDRLEDYHRLLRQAQPITTVRYLDSAGREQIRISNLEPTVTYSGEDYSESSPFRQVRPGKPYLGPVYFRRDSEPYLTLSVAEPAGRGVTVAEVNLKQVTDAVRGLGVGGTGYAYIVDSSGRLIAHPDLSTVLRQITLTHLPQVRQALSSNAKAQSALNGRGLDGHHVLASYDSVPEPGWLLFVEQAPEEAFSPLYASLARTLGLLFVALLASAAASFALTQRMTRPIGALQRGAARFGAGSLDARIDVKTGDELEVLADDFNKMASQLQDLYTGLEQRVTERTEELAIALRELEQKSRQLEIASRNKTIFLTSMSHELRWPLNLIIGYSQILSRQMAGPVSDMQEEYLSYVLDAGNHLLLLITDILDLARIEEGIEKLELGDFWLPETLGHAVQMLRETANRKELSIDVAVSEEVGMVEADQRRVRQMVFNLLSNALKFTPPGGSVGVKARYSGELVEIAVHDTGVGIDPEDHSRIFEPFQQAKNAKGMGEGTGLGLSLVKRWAELHGGHIEVDSQPGLGSTFTFVLPIRQSPIAADAADETIAAIQPIGLLSAAP
jgi:signal transduction histidine kinase